MPLSSLLPLDSLSHLPSHLVSPLFIPTLPKSTHHIDSVSPSQRDYELCPPAVSPPPYLSESVDCSVIIL